MPVNFGDQPFFNLCISHISISGELCPSTIRQPVNGELDMNIAERNLAHYLSFFFLSDAGFNISAAFSFSHEMNDPFPWETTHRASVWVFVPLQDIRFF
jgi:hypothetical protein